MRIALATNEELAELNDDDRSLLPRLAALGIDARPAVWTDRATRWSDFDAVLLRSTWGYYLRYPEFLTWLRSVAATTPLWNPEPVVRWNSHKSYLQDLEARGVPVVPTELCSGLDRALDAVRRSPSAESVVKPAVSAGGYRTYRIRREELDRGELRWEHGRPDGELLVQPYVEEVERSGERSLVYVRGRFSHAFLRAPKLGGAGGLTEGSPVRVSPEEQTVASLALAAAPGPTLYARVDLVRDPRRGPCVMELELIEPHLQLLSHTGAAEMLARAIADTLAGPDDRPPDLIR